MVKAGKCVGGGTEQELQTVAGNVDCTTCSHQLFLPLGENKEKEKGSF